MNIKHISFFATFLLASCSVGQYDVVVVGGGASGSAAALQASRDGAKTLIIEQTPWLGGMLTSAGVSAIDGNFNLRGGIFGEFCDSLARRYGGYEALASGWVSNIQYGPKVGEEVFENMLSGVEVCREAIFESASFDGSRWRVNYTVGGKRHRVSAKVLVDGTELGDVAAAVGVPYDLGMEARKDTGEDIAPLKENDIIQDLTYVVTVRRYDEPRLIEKPEGYDESLYSNCTAKWSPKMMLSYGRLPDGDMMLNWPLDGNDSYLNPVELSLEQRDSVFRIAKNITLGYLYYIQNNLGYKNIGIADDVYPTEDGLALIPYYRESRRIHGVVRFTVSDVSSPYRNTLYRTAVAVGDYAVDHHHNRYNGSEAIPDLHFHPVPSFSVPLGVVVPEGFKNLLVVEKSVSVSNIVNGATRLQPVVMEIGQAAGAMAAMLCEGDFDDFADINVRSVQDKLLNAGCYILPYLDVPMSDPSFGALQRIGATGILRSVGRNEGWTNQTWLRSTDLLYEDELFLSEYYPSIEKVPFHNEVSVERICEMVSPEASAEEIWSAAGLGDFDPGRSVLRGEAAVLIDRILDPFHAFAIDLKGSIIDF